jgi:hypothetical protein
MPPNLAAKDTRLGLVPDLIGAFKLDPSVRIKIFTTSFVQTTAWILIHFFNHYNFSLKGL